MLAMVFTDSFHKFLSSAFAIAFAVKPVHLFYFNFYFGFEGWIWKGHIWHIEIAVKLISKLAQLSYNEFAVLRVKANKNLFENLAHCCSSSLNRYAWTGSQRSSAYSLLNMILLFYSACEKLFKYWRNSE